MGLSRGWVEANLWQFVPQKSPHGVIVTDEARRAYAERLELARCPGVELHVALLDKLNADLRARVEKSELPDMMHVYAVPYCDMTTLDGRMHNILLQTPAGKRYRTKVALNAREALERLGVL